MTSFRPNTCLLGRLPADRNILLTCTSRERLESSRCRVLVGDLRFARSRRIGTQSFQEAAMRGLARLFAQSFLVAATGSFFSADGRLRGQSVASEQDLLLGSWQLDLVKSRYTPGPPPRSEVRTYVRDKEGVKGTIQRRRDDGREEVIEYRADFDREYPVMGTPA